MGRFLAEATRDIGRKPCNGEAWILLLLILWVDFSSAQGLFIANNTVPPGFESLSRPQRSLVDIYYGDRYITSQMVSYTPAWVSLSNPAQVISQITDITDPQRLTRLLEGELDSNSQLLCPPGQTRNCGRLTPEVIGVIFDDNRFRLDIFINRSYLLTQQASVQRYLPPSDGGLAFLQNFSATATGTHTSTGNRNSNKDYTLGSTSLLSWRENSLYLSGDYTRNQKFTLDRLYGQRNFEGIEWQGGILSSRGFGLSFTSDRTLLGARVATSTSTRLDTDFTSGTPVDVFLPTRGRVELRRDGKLLESQFFEAGNHQLNTSSLPDGAYDLDIRVVDDFGNQISRESRFFAKQNRLPEPGEWVWFAESGSILRRSADHAIPRATSQQLSRGGISRRLSDVTAGTLALAVDNDEALAELGLFYLGRGWDISPSLMLDNSGAHGTGFNLNSRWHKLGLNGSYRRLWNDSQAATTTGNTNNFSLLGPSFEQISGSLSYPFLTGSMQYRYSANKRQGDTTEQHAINWRGQLWRTSDYDMDMNLSWSQSGDNQVALLSLNLRLRADRWDFRASPSAEWNKTPARTRRSQRANLSASWSDGDLYDANIRFNSGLTLESGQQRINGQLQYSDHRGAANINLAHTRTDNARATSYGLNLSTSLITDGSFVSIGGEERAQSAVVINIDGREDDRFDVFVNGQRSTYAVVGQPSLVPLSPFRQYSISVRPAGTAMYRFDEKVEQVTLYPGNVVRLDIEAVALQLAFGRIKFNGTTAQSARITGGLTPVNVDEYGLFQVEMPLSTKSLNIQMDNGWLCKVPLPEQREDHILRLGTINLSEAQCQPILEGQLAVGKK